MRTYREPAREVPIVDEVDVIVAGGGPGGLPAAVAAARHGASVLLVERYGFLGGMAAAGLVAPILGHTASRGNTPEQASRYTAPIVEGLLKEIAERMHALGGAPSWEETLLAWGIYFDAEALKRAADELVQEAGVNLLLHAMVTDSIVEDGRIKGLIVESKSGRQAVMGNLVIDATGDADVAYRAGAPTRRGRDFDGLGESAGSFLHIGGVSHLNEEQRANAVEKVEEAALRGRLHLYNPLVTKLNAYHREFFSPNMTRALGDPTDVRDLTRMELDVRRDIWDVIRFLREEAPGFEQCYLRAIASQVGIRESRQVIGDYVLTGSDVVGGRKFEDAIARGSWFVDIHCPYGHTMPVDLCVTECVRQGDCPFWVAEHEGSMVSRAGWGPPIDDWYEIPYRCLVPKDVDQLLVSGRCISADHEGMAGARVMGTCIAIGQAAGTAAALALRDGVGPRDVDIDELRRVLRADGALV